MKDIIILFLPLIVFIGMFLLWVRYGRNPKGLSTIVAEYEPPLGMKPTLVGSLIDGEVDNKDITAGIIYFAERGYIKINKLEQEWLLGVPDYELELINNNFPDISKADKGILYFLFDNDLSLGKKKKISEFKYDKQSSLLIKELKKDFFQEMTDMGFYENNPLEVKEFYKAIGTLVIFFGFLMFLQWFNSSLLLSTTVSGLIIIFFGRMMGKKTKFGVETRNQLFGFKEFLSMTEKDRINFENSPQNGEKRFMEFLPYAIALGIEKKWARQFAGVYIPDPSWYHNNVSGSFIAMDFILYISRGVSSSFGKKDYE